MDRENLEKKVDSIERTLTEIDKCLLIIHADILIHRSECREMVGKQDKE